MPYERPRTSQSNAAFAWRLLQWPRKSGDRVGAGPSPSREHLWRQNQKNAGVLAYCKGLLHWHAAYKYTTSTKTGRSGWTFRGREAHDSWPRLLAAWRVVHVIYTAAQPSTALLHLSSYTHHPSCPCSISSKLGRRRQPYRLLHSRRRDPVGCRRDRSRSYKDSHYPEKQRRRPRSWIVS